MVSGVERALKKAETGFIPNVYRITSDFNKKDENILSFIMPSGRSFTMKYLTMTGPPSAVTIKKILIMTCECTGTGLACDVDGDPSGG